MLGRESMQHLQAVEIDQSQEATWWHKYVAIEQSNVADVDLCEDLSYIGSLKYHDDLNLKHVYLIEVNTPNHRALNAS